jgi:hypothetical protein
MKTLSIAGSLFLLALASSCSTNQELIKKMSSSCRQDVIQPSGIGEKAPAGYVDLTVHASLKLHKSSAYAIADSHGSPDYRMLLNIDGQVIALTAHTCIENNEARYLNDPEAGDGIRYQFTKRVRIKAGTHKVAVVIPQDDIALEREVTLADGKDTTLTLEPVYGAAPGKQGPGFYGAASFREGIRSIRFILNGQVL